MIERVMNWAGRFWTEPAPLVPDPDPLGLAGRCKHGTLMLNDCPLCRDPSLHYVIHLPMEKGILPCCGRSLTAVPEHDLVATRKNRDAATCPMPGNL